MNTRWKCQFLTTYKGKLNGPTYLKIVQTFDRVVKRKHLFFPEDNTPCHTAKTAKAAVRKMFKLILLPLQSPELNPLENLWAYLKDQRPNRIMKNDELTQMVIKEWDGLSKKLIRKYMGSMKKNCKAVIKSKEGYIKY